MAKMYRVVWGVLRRNATINTLQIYQDVKMRVVCTTFEVWFVNLYYFLNVCVYVRKRKFLNYILDFSYIMSLCLMYFLYKRWITKSFGRAIALSGECMASVSRRLSSV